MKKDIELPKVEHVGVCAVPDNVEGMEMWRVHLINQLDTRIEKILVNSRGYGKKGKEMVKTSALKTFKMNWIITSKVFLDMLYAGLILVSVAQKFLTSTTLGSWKIARHYASQVNTSQTACTMV